MESHAMQERDGGLGTTALKIVFSMLPLHAEEGGRREVVPESAFIQALSEQSIPIDTSTALLLVLRRQFEALALLDVAELHKGNWAFVSFPASLLAFSWLATLCTPGQALLAPNYWEQGDARPEGIKEEQRTLLHRVETERVQRNAQAPTIRTVHVAWALLRWGDKFLLHHREDKARPGEKNYGLVGGRFSLSDLPPETQSRTDILKEVINPDSEVIAEHIGTALQREVEEETGLLPNKHYTFGLFGQPLPPYKEVNGAGNRHAYSTYKLHLFQIKLTPAGETHLLARIAQDTCNKLTWFTGAEIAAPQRADGAAAYVDALRQAWGQDLEKVLSAVPVSADPPAFAGESQMLDLPRAPGAPFQFGKPGKEKAIRLLKALEEDEWQLLMLLGWHARGFRIELATDAGIRLLGNGWIDAPGLVSLARSLLEKIPPALGGLVEVREDRFVSLRVASDALFFSAGLFRYQIRGSNSAGGELRLVRLDLETPWARLKEDAYERSINGNTVVALRELEKGDEPAGDWERSLREQLGSGVRGVGLRRLWRTGGNVSSLVDGLTGLQ